MGTDSHHLEKYTRRSTSQDIVFSKQQSYKLASWSKSMYSFSDKLILYSFLICLKQRTRGWECRNSKTHLFAYSLYKVRFSPYDSATHPLIQRIKRHLCVIALLQKDHLTHCQIAHQISIACPWQSVLSSLLFIFRLNTKKLAYWHHSDAYPL